MKRVKVLLVFQDFNVLLLPYFLINLLPVLFFIKQMALDLEVLHLAVFFKSSYLLYSTLIFNLTS